MNNDEKIALIDKIYKKDELLFKVIFTNYEKNNFYMRLDYIKKTNEFRLSWVDLDIFDGSINTEYVIENQVLELMAIFQDQDVVIPLKKDKLNDTNRVLVYIYSSNILRYEFCDYIPEEYAILFEFFVFLFYNLPHKLAGFLYQLAAELNGEKEKYEYEKPKKFDLYNDDLSKIFPKRIIQRGTDYYQEDKVLYLEQIDNRFYAIVGGTNAYAVIINWDSENLITQAHCSCECEFLCKHTCAVIMAIRNKETKRFFKIMFKDDDLYETVFNFNYILCWGIIDDKLQVLTEEGDLELLRVIDDNGYCPWQVLEDDEYETLTKEILAIKKRGNVRLAEYRFAYVEFQDVPNKYYYYLDEIGVKKHDVVLVDRLGKKTLAYVINISNYNENNAPYPIDKVKEVLEIVKSNVSKEDFLDMEYKEE